MTELTMGCFGSVLVNSPTDSYCQRCPKKAGCDEQAAINRLEIKRSLGLVEEGADDFWSKSNKTRKPTVRQKAMQQVIEPTVVEEAPVVAPLTPITNDLYAVTQRDDLPKKVQAELVRWMGKGIDLAPLASGIDPFKDRDGMAVASMVVRNALCSTGPRTRNQVADSIIAEQVAAGGKVWTMPSVKSNVNIVTASLEACGYKILKEGK